MTQKEFLQKMLEGAAGNGKQSDMFLQNGAYRPDMPSQMPFTFIDLFAGIGGFRIALERLGGRSAFSCEWDKYAQRTYHEWFGETPVGDIRDIAPPDIPDHDLLAAGFPCQPFSIAGVSKKNSLGRAHGFKDATQGTLFFHLAQIIEAKRPPVAILENVKNLRSHDKGRTWDVINSTLQALRYRVFSDIVDARHWVPQHRERIFLVCFDKDVFGDYPPFKFGALPSENGIKFSNILESTTDSKYTLSEKLWRYLQLYAEKHRQKGNGFGFGMTNPSGVSRTLSARYYKDGSEVLISQGKRRNPRRLTPREAARLMGFPDLLPIKVSDTQAYKQFGNAVVPAVVEHVGRSVMDVLAWQIRRRGNGCLLKKGN